MNSPIVLALTHLSLVLLLVAALWAVIGPQARGRHIFFGVLLLASLSALVAGLGALLGHTASAEYPALGLPWLHWHLTLDPLAGFFLALIGLISTAVSLYGPDYLLEHRHDRTALGHLGFFTALFVLGMELVVLAGDAFAFMVAWELMSLASYFLVVFRHEQAANRRAAFLYLLMAQIGGLFILLGFGVLASFGGGFAFDAMREAVLSPLWASVAFGLAFVGFGMKAGLVPLHAWLPEAHPVAPSHVSALMSGVMLKVAVYGFIRFVFDLIGDLQWQWGVVVLAVGSVSALMGVLYALMQHDLKRLLAYHSVENIGIIFIGLGLGIIFLASGQPLPGVLGLVAALYHCLNHALFKSLLFLGAGAILHTSHERDLERMGGLLRRMPWTGLFFLVGCLSISALPPFNGFVSEWLTFQTALQAWSLEGGVMRSLIPIAAAMLALTGALAAACFVKVYGVAFLWQARSRPVRRARPTPLGMRLGQGLLALLCLLAGVFPTGLLQLLDAVPQQLFGQGLTEATAHGWLWLTPLSARTASYAAPIVVIALAAVWLLGVWWLRRLAVNRIRVYDPWDCGFASSIPRPSMQYTATAFTQPIRRIFGVLFHLDERVERGEEIRYQLQVGDRAWGLFYQPVERIIRAAARRIGFLQSGQVRVYLGGALMTLLVLLWLIS